MFKGLVDRLARYYPLFHKLFPDRATRPRQQEVLIEFCRKGKVDEALRAFKKIYLEVVHRIIEHLEAGNGRGLCGRGSDTNLAVRERQKARKAFLGVGITSSKPGSFTNSGRCDSVGVVLSSLTLELSAQAATEIKTVTTSTKRGQINQT